MSVASLYQGCTGISCPRGVLGFSLHLEWEYFKHSSQLSINFSSWSLKPGQQTVSLALSLHLPRPKCPSCVSWRVAWHFLWGITMQAPFKTIPYSTVSSSLKVQYGEISLGTSLMVPGYPCIIVCLSKASSSTSLVAILISFRLPLLALSWLVIWWIWSSGNLMVSFWQIYLDKQSTSWFLTPGIYLTVKW